MKRLLTALLALCMLLTAIGAAGEAPADQEALSRAFGGRLSSLIYSLAPGRALTLTADTPDGRHWQAEAAMAGASYDPVWDFTLSTPEGAPIAVHLASGICRISRGDQAWTLNFTDPGALVRSALAVLGVPAEDTEGNMALLQRFLADAVLPHLSYTGEGQDLHLRLCMTFAEAAEGLGAFVDHALADPAQAAALTAWLRFAERMGLAAPGTAEGFAENWPDLKAQLLAWGAENDGSLTAGLDFASTGIGGMELHGSADILPKDETGLFLTLDVSGSSRALALSASLGSVYGETRSAAYDLSLSVDMDAGTFEGCLSMPYDEYSLTGSWTGRRRTSGFQASLTRTSRWSRPFALTVDYLAADLAVTADAVLSNGDETWALNWRRNGNSLWAALHGEEITGELNAAWQNGTVTGNLNVNDGSETLAGLLYWSDLSQSLSISCAGETLLLEIREDYGGRFAQARFRQIPARYGSGEGVDLRLVPGRLSLTDNARILEAVSTFLSETEHTLTIESTPRSTYYADEGPETERCTVRSTLSEEPDAGRLDTVVEKDGDTLLTLCLVCAPR